MRAPYREIIAHIEQALELAKGNEAAVLAYMLESAKTEATCLGKQIMIGGEEEESWRL